MQMLGLVTDPDQDGVFVTGDSGLDILSRFDSYDGDGLFTGGTLKNSDSTFDTLKAFNLDVDGDGTRNEDPNNNTAYLEGLEYTFTANSDFGDGTFTDNTLFRWTFDGRQYDNLSSAINPVPEPSTTLLSGIALSMGLLCRRRTNKLK